MPLVADSSPLCLNTSRAFDIGSPAIRAQIARVDACTQQVLKVLYPAKKGDTERNDLPFGDGLRQLDKLTKEGKRAEADSEQRTWVQRGAAVLHGVQGVARSWGAENCWGVATAAFRESPRGLGMAIAMSKETGVPIAVIPQEREGQLEVFGALARASLSTAERKRTVVWGVGSTSQQLTPTDGTAAYDGKIAALGFRDQVLAEVKKSKAKSLNPMSGNEVREARKLAQKDAADPALPEVLRQRLHAPETVVIRIGGTLNLSVGKQVGANGKLTLPAIQRAIETRIAKGDLEPLFYGEEHAPTQLTNLILIEGFFQKLGMHEVRLVQSNLIDGLLVHPDFWNRIWTARGGQAGPKEILQGEWAS